MPEAAAKIGEVPDLAAFRRRVKLSTREICKEIHRERGEQGVQNEAIAVKNLTKIIDATLALANRKGFAAMSLRELSERTGLSMGGLYAYIRSKDELAELIQVYGRRQAERLLNDALQGITDPEARLWAALRTHLYLSEVLRDWFYFSYMEARHLSRAAKRRAVEGELATERLFQSLIEDGVKVGVLRTGNAQMTAALLKAMLQDWYVKRWKFRERKIEVEDYADFLQDSLKRQLSRSDNNDE